MTKKYVVANWKMSPTSTAEAEDILAYIDEYLKNKTNNKEHSLIICPPFVFLDDVSRVLNTSRLSQQAELGAQDIALADSGAWTGEVSGPMLKRLGVEYVIVGHSERRWKINESNEVVNKKLKTILANDLTPIVCVGEKVRDENFKEFLKKQIEATFTGLSADEIGKCLIAYEPVWAISSNPDARPDTPESALESISIIQDCLTKSYSLMANRYLYGGSITASNVQSFLSLEQIAGVLVGGASVKKEEFVQILKNL
ncbi:MAG: triose-phosphate isomerase [Candidatus Yanofskybacteria bacterium RIFCSPHIGHO2_01_FULL_41_21]|uniref:Triosephosphate isomerase n=1 Tax=Candidatus Yanofskybacteria bacterium RIFCSPHIGHO2_01_FULL_41_21 TaxID=1802660 RepID=A0A1F8EB21_9BACT|nr:MAG: triose-phosphate isomerase [Candidatus Yanofskybacteria bacterium RIFCSPHIGHO2_01_FULL_41_21]